jgi:hypothetical protein
MLVIAVPTAPTVAATPTPLLVGLWLGNSDVDGRLDTMRSPFLFRKLKLKVEFPEGFDLE